MPDRHPTYAYLILGLVTGVASAFFGIGGGLIMVPSFLLVFGEDIKRALGTSLMTMIPMAIAVGITEHFVKPANQLWLLAGCLAAGAIIGSWLGTQVVRRLASGLLRRIFSGFLVVIAVWMVIRALEYWNYDSAGATVAINWSLAASCAGVGLFGGLVSSFFGVGGGVIFVPALVLLGGASFHEARATSMITIIPTALTGALIYRKLKHFNRRAAWGTVPGAVLGGVAGTIWVQGLGGNWLKIAFAVLLVLAAIRLFFSRPASPPPAASSEPPAEPRA